MEYLRLFENYKSDEEIHEICKKYYIRNYTINKDGSVDVNGYVNLQNRELTELPLTFKVVNGDFYCDNNKLTTLKGSPIIVNYGFSCEGNNLTSLKGSPRIVNGNFYCDNNKLTNLIGSPDEVGGWYSCRENEQLTSLEGIAKKINGFLNIKKCNLNDFRGIPDDFYIGRDIYFDTNPVYHNLRKFLKEYDIDIRSIKNKYLDLILEINELDAIQDGKIVDIRMDEVLYNIGLI